MESNYIVIKDIHSFTHFSVCLTLASCLSLSLCLSLSVCLSLSGMIWSPWGGNIPHFLCNKKVNKDAPDYLSDLFTSRNNDYDLRGKEN